MSLKDTGHCAFLPFTSGTQGTICFCVVLHCLMPYGIWQEMADVAANPERHTLLPLPAWGVIPGARFREVYYWDSLWVVRGLLVSGMRATAQALRFITLCRVSVASL